MKNKITPIILTITALFISSSARAEGGVIDFLGSIGKIYSVIAVIVVILLGIGYFLIRLDHKLTKLEKQINNNE